MSPTSGPGVALSPERAPSSRSWRGIAERVRVWIDALHTPNPAVAPLERGALQKVIGLWAVGRALNLLLLWLFFEVSRLAGLGFGPHGARVRTFVQFLTGWDADHYGSIAVRGYPLDLPTDAAGVVQENNWAFMPLFPFLERTIANLTGLSWEIVGIGLSIAASLGATLLLYILLRAVSGPRQAWWAVTIFTFAPLSFVFVLAYAESLFLMLLFAGLLFAVRRQYWAILPVGLLATYTRPGILAFALGLGFIFALRWYRNRIDPFPWRERVALGVTGVTLAVAGLSWTWIAEAATGTPHAYLRTETAWWIPLVGEGTFVPFTPWFRMFGTYLGILGMLLVCVIMVGAFWWLFSRPLTRLGPVVVSYGIAYALYLFAVFLPQASTFRLLMPISPLLADERFTATRARKQWLLLGCIGLQVVAAFLLWTIGYP